MNAKISMFFICVKVIIYLLLYNVHDCIFNALEIKTSLAFDLDFPINAILSCFFLFFLIINLYFLILAVIAQNFHPTPELVIPTGRLINNVNAEIETQPVTVEGKIRKCPTKFKFLHVFLCFLVISSPCFISFKR